VPYYDKLFLLKERFPFYHDQIVEKYATRYGLEKELIFAIIKQESAFNTRAQSWANAYGLMQLIKITAKDMARLARVSFSSTEQLFKPDYNIHLGSLYVKQLSRRLKHKEYILAAYNAGPHRVKRWLKRPGSDVIDVFVENIEYRETRNYVRRVMKSYWGYRLLNNNFNVDVDQVLLGYVNN
jgi:soluble lytic murein transglycosylase